MWVALNDVSVCRNMEAERQCEALVLGGYSDWRLPTTTELSGIYNNKSLFADLYSRAGTALTSNGNTVYVYDLYWSSGWQLFSFYSGVVAGSLSSSSAYKVEVFAMSARCVRSL